jgi:hypothetical protein
MAQTQIEQRCRTCGHAIAGNFCVQCGAPTADKGSESWSGVASDILGGQPGLLIIIAGLTRHPIRTIIALTEDRSYTQHWKLFTLSLSASLPIFWILIPRLASWLRDQAPSPQQSMVPMWEGMLIALLMLVTPVLYYVCRFFGRIPRTSRAYFKFCALVAAYVIFMSALGGIGEELLK